MSSGSVRKGSWTQEEDTLLRHCIQKYGEGKWHQVPHRAGLNRCRKSCRLRWLNYLRPHIKRGSFSLDEDDLIIRLHKLLGNRWSLIAGRIPGRTANDVKNHWNTHIKKKIREEDGKGIIIMEEPARRRRNTINVIKPRPRTFSKNSPWLIQNVVEQQQTNHKQINIDRSRNNEDDHDMQWLENLWSEEIWGGAGENDFTNFCI